MTKDEALKMAGFDLDGVIADGYREGLDNVSLSTIKRVRKTIADYVAQPAQEPVAWIKQDNYGTPSLVFNGSFKYESSVVLYDNIPLYPHPAPSCDKVSRLEVIDNNGRAYVNWGVDKIEFSYQDDGKTLKIFTNGSGDKPSC